MVILLYIICINYTVVIVNNLIYILKILDIPSRGPINYKLINKTIFGWFFRHFLAFAEKHSFWLLRPKNICKLDGEITMVRRDNYLKVLKIWYTEIYTEI